MSVSVALNTALTGLTAASRSADVVAENVANALTPGYARREIELAPLGVGQGVEVRGIDRVVDGIAVQDRRAADAGAAGLSDRIDFYETVTQSIGLPGTEGGLSGLIADFEAALVSAAARPESAPALSVVVGAASAVADRLGAASDVIQTARLRADGAINTAVDQLNADLARVADLNQDIRRATLSGADTNALLDARQNAVDRIAELVPVRELDRDHGAIALLSEGGLLLDSNHVTLAFTPSVVVDATTTLGGGSLSGIASDGVAVDMTRPKHLLSGGRLQALFDIRDEDGVAAQANLDALAREFVTRFEAVDTDAAGAGLFTDAGSAYVAGSETGLSARMAVNGAVDEAAGGASWRLRDGLSAALPGPSGDSTLLRAYRDAMTRVAAPVSAQLGVVARDLPAISADMLSGLTTGMAAAEGELAHMSARATALADRIAADGVDSDAELQALLLIERIYAANAQVVSAAGRMIDALLEI